MIDDSSDIPRKLSQMKSNLNKDFPAVHRIAIATYHAERDTLQTYFYDEDVDSQLQNYEAPMQKCLSLQKLVATKSERVINDLSDFKGPSHFHTEVIRQAGYRSSFSVPLMVNGQLHGFLFANSRQLGVFTPELVERLKLISTIIAMMMHQNYEKLRVLRSSIDSLKIIGSHTNPEAAERLQRTARYTLLISRHLADKYQFNDIYIDFMYLYASLHDIGQIKVPDTILLKKGTLTEDETLIMQRHTKSGLKLVEKLIDIYGLDELPYINILTAMVHSHHEKMDGSGYPEGLVGDDIPIEARIVAVADILDALLCERPYKRALSIEEAMRELRAMSGSKIDADCVDALVQSRNEIQAIREDFADQVIMFHNGDVASVSAALLNKNRSVRSAEV